MRDLWLIARREFWNVVKDRRFLFFALGMPLLIVATVAIPVGLELLTRETAVVGYVDESGLLTEGVLPDPDTIEVGLRRFPDEATGRAVLSAKEIRSLWIVPADYGRTGRLRVVVVGDQRGADERAIAALIRANLLQDAPPGTAARVTNPTTLIYRTLSSGQRVRQGVELIFALAVPLGVAVASPFAIAFGSGLLATAVAEEKENRVMEILVTSTRPWSLIGGKALGLGAVALLQVAFWFSGILMAAGIFFLRGELPRGLPIPWDLLGWAMLFFVLTFLLFGTLQVGIGVVVSSTREAQQVSGILVLLSFIPFWLIAPILQAPDGTVSRGLTLFPFTAATLVPFRLAMGKLGALELLASLVLLLVAIVAAIWLVTAIFRTSMLRYGTRPSARQLFATLKANRKT